MIQPIELTNLWDPKLQQAKTVIMEAHPIKNLTEDEVLTTLRLLEIQVKLGSPEQNYNIDVYKNDKRLVDWSCPDLFLAMLLECDQQDLLLRSRRCMYCFGKNAYFWRKIGRTCPITTTQSGFSDEYAGYYGRGWVIAPHIKTLINWIKYHTDKVGMFHELSKTE